MIHPDFYKINSTDSSPSYEEVKPDSPAGKYKNRIEKAYDSVVPQKKK